MEEIRWIETPRCSQCKAPAEWRRRFACMGCERFRSGTPARRLPARNLGKESLPPAEQAARDGEIGRLREAGQSYGQIAKAMGLPRSTVQSIAARVRKRPEMYEMEKQRREAY